VGCRIVPVCLKADQAVVTGCLQIGELRLPVNKPLVHRRPDNVIRTFHRVLYMTVVNAVFRWSFHPLGNASSSPVLTALPGSRSRSTHFNHNQPAGLCSCSDSSPVEIRPAKWAKTHGYSWRPCRKQSAYHAHLLPLGRTASGAKQSLLILIHLLPAIALRGGHDSLVDPSGYHVRLCQCAVPKSASLAQRVHHRDGTWSKPYPTTLSRQLSRVAAVSPINAAAFCEEPD